MWLSRGDVTNGNHSATSMSVVEWCCVWLGYSLTSRIDIFICYLSFGCQEECIHESLFEKLLSTQISYDATFLYK
jgi:hypothetical protein